MDLVYNQPSDQDLLGIFPGKQWDMSGQSRGPNFMGCKKKLYIMDHGDWENDEKQLMEWGTVPFYRQPQIEFLLAFHNCYELHY